MPREKRLWFFFKIQMGCSFQPIGIIVFKLAALKAVSSSVWLIDPNQSNQSMSLLDLHSTSPTLLFVEENHNGNSFCSLAFLRMPTNAIARGLKVKLPFVGTSYDDQLSKKRPFMACLHSGHQNFVAVNSGLLKCLSQFKLCFHSRIFGTYETSHKRIDGMLNILYSCIEDDKISEYGSYLTIRFQLEEF